MYVITVVSNNDEFMLGITCEKHKTSVFSKIKSLQSDGKIPNGTYLFTSNLFSGSDDVTCGGGAIDTFTRDVEIYEPTFLDLQSPGYKNLSEASQSPELSTYPNFIWSTDMCSACNYGIRVCEYNPSIHDSPSSALNDISSLPADQSLDYFPIPAGQTVFSYPPTGGIDLLQEKYYVWQIKRDYGTTVGIKEDYSDIFIFQISSFESTSSSNIDFLKNIIGDSNFNNLFGDGVRVGLSCHDTADHPHLLSGYTELRI